MPYRLPFVACLATLCIATPLLADGNDPKTALTSFYQAMEAGDAAAVRASFHTSSDAEQQLADAVAAQLTAAKALGDAAKAKFAATGDSLSKGLPMREAIAQLDSAQVTVNGDHATVKLPNQSKPLTLIK
ncbi:MAG TPA: hypothetical protein VH475_10840, partial [Tepidisphaeraceae bacterium]